MKHFLTHIIDKKVIGLALLLIISPFTICLAQQHDTSGVSNVWVPDLGNGQYKNPIIFADYSDPDVCRVGNNYYMVASSFDAVPGLPILKSKDLVNWKIIGHALPRHQPYHHFSKVQHGKGVWAPSIRYHDGEFYIYYPDPDYGIYMVKAINPKGPWSKPVRVMAGKGLEDPCPLWESDGKAYLVHAFAGSRAGVKSVLVINRMNEKGTKVLNNGVIVYNGHGQDRDVEGPKLYKRHGYYYIFAPAGGVTNGWQIVLRSKHIYGPYKRRKVMEQGNTNINGPHQGAWVTTQKGASWFIHFQDRGVYGRVTWLEPMKWKNGWPIIGKNQGNGIGEPVLKHKKPDVGKTYPNATPQTSDEFNSDKLGPQWQWPANPEPSWSFSSARKGYLRLYAAPVPDSLKNYWNVPHLLLQKFPAPSFTATTKFSFAPKKIGTKTGLIIMGQDYSYISVTKKQKGLQVSQTICKDAPQGKPDKELDKRSVDTNKLWFRVRVDKGGICHFSYSTDGKNFTSIGKPFQAKAGKWIGSKMGIFCSRAKHEKDAGYADFDWFRVRDD